MFKEVLLRSFVIICLISILSSGCTINQNTQNDKNESSTPLEAADFTAEISIDSSKIKPIKVGMTGVHNEITGIPYTYLNPDLIKKVNEYQNLGVVRHFGTNIHVFNWKTGMMDEEKLGQFSYDDKQQLFTNQSRLMEAKGYERLEDLREFSQQTGTRLIIVLNVFGDTPEDAGDLAKFCYDNHIPVYYFDLGNELFMYMSENDNGKTHQFKTGEDYLSRMREFDRQIKANYPGARTAASISNTANKRIDEDFKTFPNPYWDAIALHKFGGDGDTLEQAIKSANNTFLNWALQLKNTYIPFLPDPNTPIMVEEHSVELSGRLALTHYNGIVVSENTLRFSINPNVEYVRTWRLSTIASADEEYEAYKQKLYDAYQKKVTIDTNSFKFDFKEHITGVPQRILDGALYYSNEAWDTKVNGGTTVPAASMNIPALYSQAYRGTNGKNYVIIVNKSGKSHNVTLNIDGKNVNSKMSKVTYSNSNPAAKGETNSLPKDAASGNPVYIPQYSVTRVEWTRTDKPDAPPPSWITHADAGNNSVELRWLKSVNATGYKVKYGTSKDNLSKVIDAGNKTALSINNIKNGETYYFAVAAYNKTGESEYSNKIVQNGVFVNEVSAKLAAPETPVITDVHPEKSNRMVVEWRSVPNSTGYKLKYGTSPNNYTQEIDMGNHVGKIVDFLTNGQTYYFTVSAYNTIGESSDSAEASGTPTAGLPLAPYNLSIVNEEKDSINLTWVHTKAEKEVEYFEDDNQSDWYEAAGQWSVVDHPDKSRNTKLYRSNGQGKAISVWQQAGNSEEDQEIELTIDIPKIGAASEVGIISNFKDINNYYRFTGSSKGFQIVKTVDGVETVLKEVPWIMRTYPINMQLILNGDELTGFYNNKEVLKVKDNSLARGKNGLYSNNQEALFDSIRIKRDNAKLFNIYRSEKPYNDFVKIKTIDAKETSFTDTGLEPGKQYYYKVTAENESGESYGTSNTIRKN